MKIKTLILSALLFVSVSANAADVTNNSSDSNYQGAPNPSITSGDDFSPIQAGDYQDGLSSSFSNESIDIFESESPQISDQYDGQSLDYIDNSLNSDSQK